MDPLELVKLRALMERTSGSPQLRIGLIDGPVVTSHPDLAREHLQEIPGHSAATCSRASSTACLHGTFVAGILSAKRSSAAPAICPDCTILLRPIFSELTSGSQRMPSAMPSELGRAILDCIHEGARVLNLSAALVQPSLKSESVLGAALDEAARRGVIVIAAAGNQGTVGSTTITRHPWVIPVVAYDQQGNPLNQSNLGNSIGRRGLGAPGTMITSLGSEGKPLTMGGTSAAAPFVTGAIALLWSEFPDAKASEVKFAVTQGGSRRRATLVPPLLNAWGSYQYLLTAQAGKRLS
jgi:subtilisin family serine protease